MFWLYQNGNRKNFWEEKKMFLEDVLEEHDSNNKERHKN